MPNRKNYDDAAVAGLFAAQGGLAMRAQLLGLGVPPSTIVHRTRADGPWSALFRGMCADRGRWSSTADETERLRAASLYAGAHAVISGIAALRLHDVRSAARPTRLTRGARRAGAAAGAESPAHAVNVLIPSTRRRRSAGFVVITRTRRMPEPVQIDGFQVAPLARAAVDACLDTNEAGRVRAIVNELIRSGRCPAGELREELEAHQSRGSATMRSTLYRLVEGIETNAERLCLRRLVDVEAPPALWNRRVLERSTGRIAVLPGALWPEYGIALEVEAERDLLLRERAAARRRWMSYVLRLTVARVTPSQMRDRWQEVWTELRGLLNRPPTYRFPPGYVLA